MLPPRVLCSHQIFLKRQPVAVQSDPIISDRCRRKDSRRIVRMQNRQLLFNNPTLTQSTPSSFLLSTVWNYNDPFMDHLDTENVFLASIETVTWKSVTERTSIAVNAFPSEKVPVSCPIQPYAFTQLSHQSPSLSPSLPVSPFWTDYCENTRPAKGLINILADYSCDAWIKCY